MSSNQVLARVGCGVSIVAGIALNAMTIAPGPTPLAIAVMQLSPWLAAVGFGLLAGHLRRMGPTHPWQTSKVLRYALIGFAIFFTMLVIG